MTLVTVRSVLGTIFLALFIVVYFRKKKREPQTTRPTSKNVVTHITVPTSDLDASLKFFLAAGLLECSRNSTGILLSVPASGRFMPMILLTKSKKQQPQAKPSAKTPVPSSMDGIKSICLMVDSIEKAAEVMKHQNFQPLNDAPVKEDRTDPDFKPMFHTSRLAFGDPHSGLVVELWEYHTLSIKVFFMTLAGFGMMEYPLLQHTTLVSPIPLESGLADAYKKLEFDTNIDFGEPSNLEKGNNYHEKVYGFATADIKRECMIKTWNDTFSVSLIVRDTTTAEKEALLATTTTTSKKTKSKTKVATTTATRIAVSRGHDKVPPGWEISGKVELVEYPAPLGKAKVQTLIDANGVAVELLEFL